MTYTERERQPDTTTHDSISAETGKNDGDKTSGDCISRTQAIDALKEKVFHNLSDEFYGAMQVLDELPSVQSEQRWIPCGERLPEVGKGVLLTTTFPTVIIGWLKSDGKWMIYENDGNSFQDYITAWMPFPEPYQEGEQE